MVACAKCGAELIGSRKFCAACGAPVKIEILEKEPRLPATTSSGLGPPPIDDSPPPLVMGDTPFAATVPAPAGGFRFPSDAAPAPNTQPGAVSETLAAPVPSGAPGAAAPAPVPVSAPLAAPAAVAAVPVDEAAKMALAASLDSPGAVRPAEPRVGPRGTAALPQFQAAQLAAAAKAGQAPPVIVATDPRGIDPFGVTHKPQGGPSPVSPMASSAMLPQSPVAPGMLAASPNAQSGAQSAGPQPYAQPSQPQPQPQPQPAAYGGQPYAPQAPHAPHAPPPQHAGYNHPAGGYVQNAHVPPWPAGLAPGAAVWVQWSNGQRYPGTVQQVSGSQCYVSFPDGQARWVESAYVSAR